MTFAQHILTLQRFSTAICCTALAACGGGGSAGGQDSSITQTAAVVSSGATSGGTNANSVSSTNTGSSTAPATSSAQIITDVRFENTDAVAQTNIPMTFGQVFAKGNYVTTDTLSGRLEDGTIVPLQVDVKATHDDGSIRHAVISAILPKLNAGETSTMTLVKMGSAPTGAALTTSAIMRTGFSFSAHAKINGTDYYASADDLFKTTKPTTWLNGPIATEWMVDAPLQTTAGVKHPHLTAHFAIRWYPGANKARVDVTVENNWAYEPTPQNFVYDANIVLGGTSVYSKANMTHYHHSRWRKMFWWNGTEPQVNIKHNTAYLINSRALPNYDRSITVPEAALASLKTAWTGAITEPGAVGMANPYMPTTGGRNDIGLLPGWAVEYLLSMDKRAKMVTLGTADLAGSWSSHYRDRQSGRPISIIDYPYMTLVGNVNDAFNPKLKRSEYFPVCVAAVCKTPNSSDSAHQPNFAYLPYLVTGDYYYLEELQFWAMYDTFAGNPYYREFEKGLVQSDQVRGQAWSLRTIAEAAYITPDNHPLKSHYKSMLDSNLDWFTATYLTGTPTSNKLGTNALGIITNGSSLVYDNGTGMGPWQDDFFTASMGHIAELGFSKADALLRWKTKFPIERMVGAGSCWIGGAMYTMKVRDSATSPIYSTIAQAFKASSADYTSTACASAAMAAVLKLKVGEMFGYSSSTMGYPSNMQPALAYAVDVGGNDGKRAWAQFMARTVKPNYSGAPQFAIVPR
jgi:hypothetical protein